MLLKLTFDHRVLKNEAKERGVDAGYFTEWLHFEVPGYQVEGPYSKEPWAVPGFTKFCYCNEILTVELAIVEGKTLILYHDRKTYPDSPVKVPIRSIRSQEKSLSISGEKPLDKKDQK